MSVHFDIFSFLIGLAVNLILVGLLVAAGVGLTFRLLGRSVARIRYVIVLGAFLIASVIPVFMTLSQSLRQSPSAVSSSMQISETKRLAQTSRSKNSAPSYTNSATTTVEFVQNVYANQPAVPENQTNFLNNFTIWISGSLMSEVFVGMWLAGSIGLIFWQAGGLLYLRRMSKNWIPAASEEKKKLGLPEAVKLYFSENESPCTTGLFSPAVILPRQFPDDLSNESIQLIINHEISHAGWRDPFANFLLNLICSLLWISPALWLLKYVAGTEQEAGADHSALVNAENIPEAAAGYATSLVSMAKSFGRGQVSSTVAAKANLIGVPRLEHRIRRILTGYNPVTGIRIFTAGIIFAATFSGIFFIPAASQPLSRLNLSGLKKSTNSTSRSEISASVKSSIHESTSDANGQETNNQSQPVSKFKLKSRAADRDKKSGQPVNLVPTYLEKN